MENKDKKQEKLSLVEQFKLYCELRREGKLHTDTDELPLPILPSVVDELKKNSKK